MRPWTVWANFLRFFMFKRFYNLILQLQIFGYLSMYVCGCVCVLRHSRLYPFLSVFYGYCLLNYNLWLYISSLQFPLLWLFMPFCWLLIAAIHYFVCWSGNVCHFCLPCHLYDAAFIPINSLFMFCDYIFDNFIYAAKSECFFKVMCNSAKYC